MKDEICRCVSSDLITVINVALYNAGVLSFITYKDKS